jgi:hypothetical protein
LLGAVLNAMRAKLERRLYPERGELTEDETEDPEEPENQRRVRRDLTLQTPWEGMLPERRDAILQGEQALRVQRQSLGRVFDIGLAFAELQSERGVGRKF